MSTSDERNGDLVACWVKRYDIKVLVKAPPPTQTPYVRTHHTVLFKLHHHVERIRCYLTIVIVFVKSTSHPVRDVVIFHSYSYVIFMVTDDVRLLQYCHRRSLKDCTSVVLTRIVPAYLSSFVCMYVPTYIYILLLFRIQSLP